MKRILLSMCVAIGFGGLVQAQTTLSAGDVAVTAYAADNPDEFSFVLLTDVISGTEIGFSDLPWDSVNQQLGGAGEGYFMWKANTNLPAGTKVNVIAPNSNGDDYEANIGVVTAPSGSAMFFSATGDQIQVFQGTVNNPTFIFSINWGSSDYIDINGTINSNRSYVPAGLTKGVNAFHVGDFDNGFYSGDSIDVKASLLNKIVNPANWTANNDRMDHDPSENGRQEFGIFSFNPMIRVSQALWNGDFGQNQVNVPSAAQSFVVLGSNLTNDITVSVGAPFEVRTGGAGSFSNSINLTPSSGNVSTTVEVRINATSGGSYADTIQISSPGAFKNQLLAMGEGLANPVVQFISTSGSFMESGGRDSIGVEVTNLGGNTVMVEIVSGVGKTAIQGTHYNFVPGPQLTFDGTTPTIQYFKIDFIDDNISGPRFRNNKLGLMVAGGDKGTNDSFEISIQENDYKYAKIAEIKQLDGDFLPISVDSLFEVTGVVYGTNTRTSGYSFTIIDETAGISNFAPSSAPDFGYTITEGDSILMRGRLTHFNGLVQLDFLDTIKLLKSGAALKMPRVVNTLDESAENDLVRVNNVAFVSPTPTWSVTGSGTNYKVYNTVTNDTFEIRVLPTSGIANTTAPTGNFDVIGLGGQYDASNPRNSGYQLFPRYTTDVIIDELGPFNLLSPADNATITLAGDPTTEVDIEWSTSAALNGGGAPTYTFMLDLPTGDFSNPVFSSSAGTDTTLTFTYKQLADAFSANLPIGGSLTLIWTVSADNGNQVEWAQDTYTITFERDIIDGIKEASNVARIYPNPANQVLTVEMHEAANRIELTDLSGKVVRSLDKPAATESIDLSGLSNGVYFIRISLNGKQYAQRLVIQNR